MSCSVLLYSVLFCRAPPSPALTLSLQLAPILLKALVGDGLNHEHSRGLCVFQLRSTVTLADILEIDEDVGVLLQKLLSLRNGSDGVTCRRVLRDLAEAGVSAMGGDGGEDGRTNELDVYDRAVQSYLSRYISFASAIKRGLSDVVPRPLVHILSTSEFAALLRNGGGS